MFHVGLRAFTLNPADPENFLFTVTKAQVEEEE